MAMGHLNWGSVASRSQRVAFNSSTVQTHVLINKDGHGETLLPGERREVELTCEYIEVMRRQRDPTRIDEPWQDEAVVAKKYIQVSRWSQPTPATKYRL